MTTGPAGPDDATPGSSHEPPPSLESLHWLTVGFSDAVVVPLAVPLTSSWPPPSLEPLQWMTVAPMVMARNGCRDRRDGHVVHNGEPVT